VLHPLWGGLFLAALLFLMFQAVFSWAEAPMGWIEAGVAALGELVRAQLPDGPLRSLLVDGIIAGVGGVLVFLPQILILFAFILALEDSGYLPRAAFLLDRVMGRVGLSGRSFIPLLSSFACAVPGIMATRTISHWRDRLVTILIAPLMTCSARLPVYALLIAAFVPARPVAGWFNLQGLVLFALYAAGILSALAMAWVYRLGCARRRRAADGAADGAAGLPLAAPAQAGVRPVGARQHLPAARGRHHPGGDGAAVVPVQLSGGARRGRGAGHSAQLCRPHGACCWKRCWRRSASTGRSPLPWCPAWQRARWRWARWARCTRCRPAADDALRSCAADRPAAGAWPPRWRCWPGTSMRRSAWPRWWPSSARPAAGAGR
jgi:hypothetical protein